LRIFAIYLNITINQKVKYIFSFKWNWKEAVKNSKNTHLLKPPIDICEDYK
jgi:hypothetical protein